MDSLDATISKSFKDPERLLRLLVVTAIVSMVVIIIFTTYSFYRIFSGFVIANAESDSVQLCSVMIDQQKPFFFHTFNRACCT
jgi:hypothetical protein